MAGHKIPINSILTIFQENPIHADFYQEPGMLVMEKIQYLCYNVEVCPDTNRRHLQMYVECKSQITKKQLKTILGVDKDFHFEARRGNQKQAIEYCTKDETRVLGPFHHGTPKQSAQGKRPYLEEVVDTIVGGATMDQVIEAHPRAYIQFNRGIHALLGAKKENRRFKTQVTWIHGLTSTGKSEMAWEKIYGDVYDIAYSKPNNKWWDGYNNQKLVIIDDYKRCEGLLFRDLLKLLDKYPHKVEYKGGTVSFTPTAVIITSEQSPEEIFYDEPQIEQLLRRIETIIHAQKNIVYNKALKTL